MASIVLAVVFAAAMFVASIGHILALVRRERALKKIYAEIALAGRPRIQPAASDDKQLDTDRQSTRITGD